MPTVADLSIKYSADTAGAEAGTGKVQGIVGNLTSGVRGLATVAGGFVLGGAIQSVVGGVGQLVAAGLDFEAGMANVNSIAQLSSAELASLTDQVFALSGDPRIVQGPAQLAEGLYDIYSSGFDGADGLKVLEAAALASTAGMTSADVASRAITASLNAYGLGADEAGRVSDVLFSVVDKGVISFEELARNLGNTLPIANSLGVGIEELGASYALMTLKGVNASQAETQIAALMRASLKPTEAMNTALGEHSQALFDTSYASVEALIAGEGFGGFLKLLTTSAGGSKEALFDMLGTQEAVNAALILGAEDGADFNAMLEEMENSSGATERALEKQMQSARFQLALARKEVERLAVMFMGTLAPAITFAASTLSRFISGGIEFVREMMLMIDTGNAFTDTWLRQFPGWAQPVIEMLMGIVMAGQDVKDAFEDLMRGDVSGFFRELEEAGRTAWSAISNLATTTLDWVLDTGIPEVKGWIVDNAGSVWEGLKTLVKWTFDGLVDLGGWTLNVGVPEVIGGIRSVAGRAGAWLKGYLISGLAAVGDGTGGPSPAGDVSLKEILQPWTLQVAVPTIVGTVTGIAGRLGDWLRGYLYSGSTAGVSGAAAGFPMGAGTSASGGIVVDIAEITVKVLDAIADISAVDVQEIVENELAAASRVIAEGQDFTIDLSNAVADITGLNSEQIKSAATAAVVGLSIWTLGIPTPLKIILGAVAAGGVSYEMGGGLSEVVMRVAVLAYAATWLPVPTPVGIAVALGVTAVSMSEEEKTSLEKTITDEFAFMQEGGSFDQTIDKYTMWVKLPLSNSDIQVPAPGKIADAIARKIFDLVPFLDVDVDSGQWKLDASEAIPGVDLPSIEEIIDAIKDKMPKVVKVPINVVLDVVLGDGGDGTTPASSSGDAVNWGQYIPPGLGLNSGVGAAPLTVGLSGAASVANPLGELEKQVNSSVLNIKTSMGSLRNERPDISPFTTSVMRSIQTMATQVQQTAVTGSRNVSQRWTVGIQPIVQDTQQTTSQTVETFSRNMNPMSQTASTIGRSTLQGFGTSLSPIVADSGRFGTDSNSRFGSGISPIVDAAGGYGRGANTSFTGGLRPIIGESGGIAGSAVGTIRGQLQSASSGAFSYGANVSAQFAAGLRSQLGAISDAAAQIRNLMPSSPAKTGPLSDPISWDYILDALSDTMDKLPDAARRGMRNTSEELRGAARFRAGTMGYAGVRDVTVVTLEPEAWATYLEKMDRGDQAYRSQSSRNRELTYGLQGAS